MPIYLEIGEFYPCVIFEIARSDKIGTCAAAVMKIVTARFPASPLRRNS